MKDRRLETFVTLAELGSFTAAARKLGLSQPTVSQQVSALESWAGGELFVRGNAPVALTPRGEVFCSYARRILSLYEDLAGAMAGEAPPASGRTVLELGDGRSAEIRVDEGELRIALK
ncbi:MAG: LysR family transcriptional regulator [Bacteroidales bacterium]|nr:LysR family transcriptional regulator [Bacteroidales bacterium]